MVHSVLSLFALLLRCQLCYGFLRPGKIQKHPPPQPVFPQLSSSSAPENEAAGQTPKPHILFILVDDVGWAEVSWNHITPGDGNNTPRLEDLAKKGVILDRHYAHKLCGPSRSAIQSGRAPIHVNVLNTPQSHANPSDPVGGFAGIPRNMTGMASVLKGAGYRTHFIGKWDAGMATPDHTPAGRGYETSLNFFHHTNDAWSFTSEQCDTANGTKRHIKDLWFYNAHEGTPYPGMPANVDANSQDCSFTTQHPATGKCLYEDKLFEDRVTSIIKSHTVSDPLFIFWSTRTAHSSLQPPHEEEQKFMFIDVDQRRKHTAMLSWIDGAVGRVCDELKTAGMYEDTLIVFSSDNGGAMPGGNNYPLKGGKFSNWEGGIRVAAFVSGGFLPSAVRGTTTEGLVAAWDWYATFAALAGADPTDGRAAEAGLPPHDSIDQWPLLSGEIGADDAPRKRLEIGASSQGDTVNQFGKTIAGDKFGDTVVGGILSPPYKLLLAQEADDMRLNYAGWTGPVSPNKTCGEQPKFEKMTQVCGRTPETGCLFDVFADPGETNNIAAQNPQVFLRLLDEAREVEATVYSPDRGKMGEDYGCASALDKYNGFWGPFMP